SIPGEPIGATRMHLDDPPIVARKTPVFRGEIRRLPGYIQGFPEIQKPKLTAPGPTGPGALETVPTGSPIPPALRPPPGGIENVFGALDVATVVADSIVLSNGASLHFYREISIQNIPGNYRLRYLRIGPDGKIITDSMLKKLVVIK